MRPWSFWQRCMIAAGILSFWGCPGSSSRTCTTTVDCPPGSYCDPTHKVCFESASNDGGASNDAGAEAHDAGAGTHDAGTEAHDAGTAASIYHSPGMGVVSGGGKTDGSGRTLIHSIGQPGSSSTSTSSRFTLHSGVAPAIGSEK